MISSNSTHLLEYESSLHSSFPSYRTNLIIYLVIQVELANVKFDSGTTDWS